MSSPAPPSPLSAHSRDDSDDLSPSRPLNPPSRPSPPFILYPLAHDHPPPPDLHRPDPDPDLISPPTQSRFAAHNSHSRLSSFSLDSKYPIPSPSFPLEKASPIVLLPYAYDPTQDQSSPPDPDDALHDPSIPDRPRSRLLSPDLFVILNVLVILVIIVALLCLFTVYPVIYFYHNNYRNLLIDNNVQVNGTGQVPSLPNLRALIDPETPQAARSRTGFDGQHYQLVFSDEFNTPGRSFYPGDDPFWEAVDLWYGATADMEWYDPAQVTTENGHLRIRIEQTDPASNHDLNYKSGMLQSWNKFCFTGGYIEVSASFPGQDSDVSGYWPGVWIMGNLARPGYPASTDGMWPYSYTACDLGTFPNQTLKDGTGPAAALHTDYGRDKYNFTLSWLPGQRASACTCPADAAEHPGPRPDVGRGAPEIDIFEAQKNKLGTGGKVSQSAQFAPFNHDYVSLNGTGQATFFNPAITQQNSYQGSALQQAASALTTVPDDTYAGAGGNFMPFGFEYYGDPDDTSSGHITWQMGGRRTYSVTAAAVGPDQLSQVSQRLIAVEPMSIVLNLGMSTSFQAVDLSRMTFPADFLVDYVRVYQPTTGAAAHGTSVGCDPRRFPTANYIAAHMDAYTNPNLTSWRGAGYTWPRNRAYDGC